MRQTDLKEIARSIFFDSLRAIDAGAAVRRTVALVNNSILQIGEQFYPLDTDTKIYVVGVGKAVYPMASALEEILGDRIKGGVISGVLPDVGSGNFFEISTNKLSSKWNCLSGGHPLPNELSLTAAQSAIELLKYANDEKSIIIFLISGGGSAMFEAPSDDAVTLADLRRANQILITCGASITEINLLRRKLSKVKGGKLAACAPRAAQVSLIISDTEKNDEKSVSSGLTFENKEITPQEIETIIERYNLNGKLPASMTASLLEKRVEKNLGETKNTRQYCVLLDNQTAVEAAVKSAQSKNLFVEISAAISQQNVERGCAEILNKMKALRETVGKNNIACLISGGEFSCPVRGNGTGGRNSESVLRTALLLNENFNEFADAAFLSAGTDGIDGNSPAAGAVCDKNTLTQARNLNLDARVYLANSDSFSFFQKLNCALMTGATGTNVRDLRLMLARF